MKIWKFVKAGLFALVVIGIAAGAVFWLTAHDVAGSFNGLANKTMTFTVAGLSVALMEAYYAWRFRIKVVDTFNRIQADGRGAGLCLGLITLGLCILAGAIFGQV